MIHVDLLRSQVSVREGDTPERRRMQISVSPKNLEHEYPNGHQGPYSRHDLMSPQ